MAQPEKQNQASPTLSNADIAARLEQVADLLEAQEANPYRVQAYRSGAQTVRQLDAPVATLLEQDGVEGLQRLPKIGESLAHSIEQLVDSGRLAFLERLRGDVRPERVFTTVPGFGPELARRVYDNLEIESLADLHAAAIDGRLADVPGFGPKRVRGVIDALSGRLRRPEPRTTAAHRALPVNPPPISELLDVDAEYRRKAAADRLVRIAPRRFNPTHTAWLPVLHTRRGDVEYTALFSNTARAHELGTTNDWVVIYRDDAHGDGQWTVITSRFGPLNGKRIVRGREEEARQYYAAPPAEGSKEGSKPKKRRKSAVTGA